MQNLRLLFAVMAIQLCPMAGAQDANDDWARAILFSIDPDKSQSEIDHCFQKAVEKSDRKADILLCQSDLKLALGFARDVVNAIDEVVEDVELGADAEGVAAGRLNSVLDSLTGQDERRRFELLVALSQDSHSAGAWLRMLIVSDVRSFEVVFQLCVQNDPGNAMPYYVKAIRRQQLGAPIAEVIALFEEAHSRPHLLLHPTPYPTSCNVAFPDELTLAERGLKGQKIPVWVLAELVKQTEQMWGYEGVVKKLLFSQLPFVSEIDDPERINESLMIEYRRFGERLVWAEPTQHLLFNGVMMELRSTMIVKRYYFAKGQNDKAENAALRFRRVRKLFDDVDLYRSEYREKAGGMVQMAEKELNPTEAVNGFIRKTRPVILNVK